MIASLPVGELERYRAMMLEANLIPVFVENELFSMVNGIYARMSTDERFKPFFVIHLCQAIIILSPISVAASICTKSIFPISTKLC